MLKSPFKAEGLNLYSLFQKISHVSPPYAYRWAQGHLTHSHQPHHRVGLVQGDYAPLPEHYSRELRELAYAMISTNASERPDIIKARRAQLAPRFQPPPQV